MIGWNGETLPGLPLEREIELAAQAGYGGIEIFIPKLAPYFESHTVEDLARLFKSNGLKPLSMNGIENINLRTPEELAALKAQCAELAELSQRIGCPTIVVVPSPNTSGASWEHIKADTTSALSELADVAAPYGVTLAFEFLAPVNCTVRTLAQGWEIVQATGRPNVGLVFDTYHFYVGGSSWESMEDFDMKRLYIVHINDAEDLPFAELTDGHRLLPGEGAFPLERMFSSLKQRGYRGAYALEVMRPAYRERDPLEYQRAGFEASKASLAEAGIA